MSRVAKVKTFDIANGKGIRTSIFFSGCEHTCKGCFNSELWDFNIGDVFDREYYETKIKPTINEHIDGISILGGEAFHPNNLHALYNLVDWFDDDFPDKTIWVWSGYTWEELMERCGKEKSDDINWIMVSIDVLADGRFVEEQKDLTLKWCGSRNQRVIDVPKSISQNKVVLYED